MTDDTEGLPGPEEMRRELAAVDGDLAMARRLIAAYAAQDAQALAALLGDVNRSGRGSKVLMAVVIQATDFGEMLYGQNFQRWIEQAAMAQLDNAEAARHALDE
jgi:hypothetical protein